MNKELTPLEALEKIKKGLIYEDEDYPYTSMLYKEEVAIVEKALKDKELQDIIINEIKDLFVFGVPDTKVEPKNNGDVELIPNVVYRITREIDNKKKEIIRNFILKQCFPKELKALEFIKEEIEFGFEIVNNQTRLTLTARGVKVMSITIDKDKYDLLKEVLKDESNNN